MQPHKLAVAAGHLRPRQHRVGLGGEEREADLGRGEVEAGGGGSWERSRGVGLGLGGFLT